MVKSPDWKQQNKPFIINKEVKEQTKYKMVQYSKKNHSTLKAIAKGFYNLIFGIPRIKVGSPPYEKGYTCPNCGQSCSKEEFESGFCLDCDQIDFFDDFEGDP